MSKIDELMDIVKGMTILELADVVKAFEEEFGVSAAPVAVAGAVAADGAAGGAAEKSAVKVHLSKSFKMPRIQQSKGLDRQML